MSSIYKIFEEREGYASVWFSSKKIFKQDEIELAKSYCEALNYMSETYFNSNIKYGVYEVLDTYENEYRSGLVDGKKVY